MTPPAGGGPGRPGGPPGRPPGGPGARFAEVQHAENPGRTIRRLAKYFIREKWLVIGVFALVIIGVAGGVIAPSMQSNAIDIIAGKRDGDLWRAIVMMCGMYLLNIVCQLIQGLLNGRLVLRIIKRIREELFNKIVELPVKYMDTHSHGDIMSRMVNDAENISSTISSSLQSLFSGVLTIVGTVAIMLWYCWQLALLSFLTVFLTVFVSKFLAKHVRRFSRERQTLLGKLNGTVEEKISGYRTVVAYNRQDETIEDFSRTSDRLTKTGVKADMLSGIMGPVMNCIGNVGFVIIAAFGGWFSVKGLISVGLISAFIVYAKQFSRPVNEIATVYGQLQTAVAGAERVFAVMDEQSEDLSGEDVDICDAAAVEFKNVNFSYVEGHPVLRDFTLRIPGGRKVALVGATGSGKTTVVNLLMRFYDPDSGEITVDGRNIKEMSRTSLRKEIAIVLQDTVLFNDTIRNNLKFANEDVTEEQLQKAVEMSRAGEMIRQLPEGLDTELAGAGENVSQGQRQLLAIAQAFVADPEILILDEATSNVDTRTEKAVQDAMQQVMRDRTGIVIAHRLSTIRDADIIVVMDAGRIVETGDHEALLAQKGKYYELYMTQFAGIET
ncbi:MAG: ABC transporter ATP-binding protein [Clostridia bacterium]|nr:ABC transporter ATP-binding protein [Clostridia bacterium]